MLVPCSKHLLSVLGSFPVSMWSELLLEPTTSAFSSSGNKSGFVIFELAQCMVENSIFKFAFICFMQKNGVPIVFQTSWQVWWSSCFHEHFITSWSPKIPKVSIFMSHLLKFLQTYSYLHPVHGLTVIVTEVRLWFFAFLHLQTSTSSCTSD